MRFGLRITSFSKRIAARTSVKRTIRHNLGFKAPRGMYWKSISQQNLPVTIKYPEMEAEKLPYFTHDKLPDHGKESLWFL